MNSQKYDAETTRKILQDIRSVRHNIDCDTSDGLLTYQGWELIDGVLADLENKFLIDTSNEHS